MANIYDEYKDLQAEGLEIRSKLDKPEEIEEAELDKMTKRMGEIETRSKEIQTKIDAVKAVQGMKFTKFEEENKNMENKENLEVRSIDDEAYEDAFFKWMQTGEMQEEYRAAATVAGNSVMVPTVTLNKILETKDTKTGQILAMVQQIAYPTGVAIPAANLGITAEWVGEGKTSAVQGASVSGTITFSAYKLQCSVGITIEADARTLSAFKETFYKNANKAIVKALETAIISGSGEASPKGITNETVDADRNITVSKFDYKTLCSIEAAIPEDYEAGAVYCMSKKSFAEFQSMTDAQGQPVARVNVGINGQPERQLLGRPVVLTSYLPTYAAAAANTVFGFVFDFSNYALNSAMNLTAREYIDEATDTKVQKLTILADGRVIDNAGLVLLKTPAKA